jgi:Zn-dependent protease with chaperone function
MVSRLERESANAPGRYRLKVAMLTLLGFGILALVLATVGLGLIVLVGFAVAVALTGGTALLLLLKLGKLLIILAIPLWYTLKSAVQALFIRMPAPAGREITRAEAPQLFAALENMRKKMSGPRFHHVLVINEVNAAVVQRPALGLVGWSRNYLLLGLPLLERMSPEEAMAVVAHEYGHLAGSHGRFSAFIYRLRHTWSTVQAYIAHFQGWLNRLVSPLVQWYAPYFNAYTFVLARADEYRADAASAELVGMTNATLALKRVNLIGPQYQRFLETIFLRVRDDASPPKDILNRWAALLPQASDEAEAKCLLEEALDRQGNYTDTHPTLRARLSALSSNEHELLALPPPIAGRSASQTWFGPSLDTLRNELQEQWAKQVAPSWGARHIEICTQEMRLQELRNMEKRDAERELEMLSLTMRLEPETDVREALAAFNTSNSNHALGLYLEGVARLDKGEREGLTLLDRAMEVDPQATKSVCERAYAFLVKHKDMDAAEIYAARWRKHSELETSGT